MKPIKGKTKKRPPDAVYGFTHPYGLMGQAELEQQNQLDKTIAIFLSGKRLEKRTTMFYSGSRTSKKLR
jgi:hypothetical protein